MYLPSMPFGAAAEYDRNEPVPTTSAVACAVDTRPNATYRGGHAARSRRAQHKAGRSSNELDLVLRTLRDPRITRAADRGRSQTPEPKVRGRAVKFAAPVAPKHDFVYDTNLGTTGVISRLACARSWVAHALAATDCPGTSSPAWPKPGSSDRSPPPENRQRHRYLEHPPRDTSRSHPRDGRETTRRPLAATSRLIRKRTGREARQSCGRCSERAAYEPRHHTVLLPIHMTSMCNDSDSHAGYKDAYLGVLLPYSEIR